MNKEFGYSARSPRALVLVVMVMSCALVFASAGVAVALPEGRVYERVSPAFKNGYPVFADVGTSDVASNGESVFFSSIGAFSGSGEDFALNPYLAQRTPTGWKTVGLFPKPIEGELLAGLEEMSPDLSQFEYVSDPAGAAWEVFHSSSGAIWVRRPDGSFKRVSPVLTTAGASFSISVVGAASDLSRFVFSHIDSPPGHISSVPGDETQLGAQLFEEDGGAPRLVAVNDQETQLTRFCNVVLGGVDGSNNAVSQPGGANVFFSVPIDSYLSEGGGCKDNPTNPVELFVRVNGAHTLLVSGPLPGECTEEPCLAAAGTTPKEAVFQGASIDGSRVYFTTMQPLVNEDKDQSNDLYMATLGANGTGEPVITSLAQVSHDSNAGEAAEVETHVVNMSADGSHVYFVAHGVLAGANAEGEAPAKGGENMYVYDNLHKSVSFVAKLCSGREASGTVFDTHCPESLNAGGNGVNDDRLWGVGAQEAQTTEDGRFLIFSTYARLISGGPEADTDNARDVYRYDTETGAMQRVSLGEEGLDGNGNNSQFDASIALQEIRGSVQAEYDLGSRAISDSGSTVVLTTAEPLSKDAINGLQDVYAWHEGRVSLISGGTAGDADVEPDITPSGNDIFFITSEGLVPDDTDGLRDMYDARVNGGFPPEPAAKEECTADGCQGPLSQLAPILVPGSAIQSAGENLPVPRAATFKPTKPKKKQTKKKRKKAKKAGRPGRVTRAKRSLALRAHEKISEGNHQ